MDSVAVPYGIVMDSQAPDSVRKFREDLFKKTMSGDGMAGRKPYGLVTRMVETVGWKRLECNKLMKFVGVSEVISQRSHSPSFLRLPFRV